MCGEEVKGLKGTQGLGCQILGERGKGRRRRYHGWQSEGGKEGRMERKAGKRIEEQGRGKEVGMNGGTSVEGKREEGTERR